MLPANAVLKEKNLENTLSILRTELTNYRSELERQSGYIKEQQQKVFTNIMGVMSQSNQNALMLYSQKPEYVFDLAYACQEATKQYHAFTQDVLPFRKFIEKSNAQVARYDSLVASLSTMRTNNLSEKALIDRNVCLTLAVNIRRTLNDNSQQMSEYIRYYKMTEERLSNLNDYANKRYLEIQNNIFSNSGENYFNTLSDLGTQIRDTKDDIQQKYLIKTRVRSQWDIRLILFLFSMIVFYGFIAGLLNYLFFRFILPKRIVNKITGRDKIDEATSIEEQKKIKKAAKSKKTCITMATSVISLAIILGILRIIFADQNFLVMASGLLVQFTWLMGVILISLLLRLKGDQIMSAFRIYSPIMAVTFIIIAFRIAFVPNDMTNLVLPPILLIATIWQHSVIKRHGKNIPKSDVVYTWMTQCVFIGSTIAAWLGYDLLSVQVIIWWTMQMACILTISCITQWLHGYFERHSIMEKPITKTWLVRFIYYVVLPCLGVYSFIIALYWAADVFNLSDTTWMIFTKEYIHTDNFSASIFTLSQVIVMYILFSYINHTTKALLKQHFMKTDPDSAASRITMSKNVIQVLVWGIWLFIVLGIFNVGTKWLLTIGTGLSAGLAFASKDILENIYYGISLMAGRVKVGDYIICDGQRGKVISISYTSTMVEATDGSVIAFTNSQLFTKNYKNLTKNHGYEMDILEVGVAYGSDIPKVKQLLIDAIEKLDCIDHDRSVKIVLKEFGDNSVNLKILVWVPVLGQYGAGGEIMECVYNTLSKNNIEIPFPQRDIRIIKEEK
jgi:small-conductance mechanosensitive channel